MPDKEYRLLMADATERTIIVPDSWKLTFGPTVPFAPRPGVVYSRSGWSLRVYEPPRKLRAVLCGVREFWDASLTIEVTERDANGMVVERYSVVPPRGAQVERERVPNQRVHSPTPDEMVWNAQYGARQSTTLAGGLYVARSEEPEITSD